MKKNKNEYFSDNPGFLGYKVNISFLTEKLPYSQICGTKVGTPDKKRRQSEIIIKKLANKIRHPLRHDPRQFGQLRQ